MTGTDCAQMRWLVQADHDGELGAGEAAPLAAHLAGCASCRALRTELAALSSEVRALTRHTAPPALRRSLQARFGPSAWATRPRRRALTAAGAMALAACLTLWLAPRAAHPAGEAVASHIRALQPGHLTDVVSADQHTVKPWFDGRLDFAPPVRDFAAAGFPLVGGRLDYLGARPVAALVYRRDRHLIDVYVWPGAGAAATATVNGYHVVDWSAGGMHFTAVSDLNEAELHGFAELWRTSP